MERVLIAGRYRLLEMVGRGGMGRVWRAHDEVLHREVAVKQIVPPSWLTGEERDELRLRTLREARTAARIDHPHVVKVYDVVPTGDSPWIVMAYVPSRTLQDVLDDDGPLPPGRTAAIGLDLLAALDAAHTSGVLHRDVKPANVLIARDGRALLTDFGLAVFDGGDGAMTRPGMVLGSPQYVAPERAAEGVSSAAADLWSLGATLYAAVEGRSPYARSTAMATLSALAVAPPDPAPNAGPLAPVLAGLLCRDPGDRTDHDETRRRLTAAAESPDPPATAAVAPVAPVADAAQPGPPATGAAEPGSPAIAPAPSDEPTTASAEPDPAEPKPDPAEPKPDPAEPKPDPAEPERGPKQEPALGDGADVDGLQPVGPPAPTGDGSTGPDGHPAHRTAVRPWALAAAALLVAVAAGMGTALAVADEPPERPDWSRPADGPGPDDRRHPPGPAPGDPWATAAGGGFDGRPDHPKPPPPGRRGFPPPPFSCVRPEVVGEPVVATAPPAGETFRPPRGWAWHADTRGFRIAVPAGWRYSGDGSVACFQDPATGRALSVATAGDDSAGALDRLRAARERALAAGTLPGYAEFRLGAAGATAEWECAWDTPHGSRLRAVQVVLAAPAAGWTLGWITHDADWTAAAAQFTTLRTSLRAP